VKFGIYTVYHSEDSYFPSIILIKQKMKNSDTVIRGQRSGWGFIAYRNERVMTKKVGAYGTTTSSMRMEIEVATEAIWWLTEQERQRAVIVTDSQSMFRKV
jgi:ribonuclease HI